MRKNIPCFIILICFVIGVGNAKGQVNINPFLPTSGIVQKSQLWNFLLVSGSPVPLSVSVKLTVSSTADNQPVLTGYTPVFLLNPGAKQFSQASFSPLTYTYPSPTFNIDRDPNGMLPIGSFQVCYTVVKYESDLYWDIANECSAIDVLPLLPPQLAFPLDKDTVQTLCPQFAWLPPSPGNMFTNLTYDFELAELRPGQVPMDALAQNLPVYATGNITSTILPYPPAGSPLRQGKRYAWRVYARNNGQVTARSDVWTFCTVPIKVAALLPEITNYLSLEKEGSGEGLHELDIDNMLGVKFYSFDKDFDSELRITDPDGRLLRTEKIRIVYGNNFFQYPLGPLFQSGKKYSVLFSDAKGTKFITRFYIK